MFDSSPRDLLPMHACGLVGPQWGLSQHQVRVDPKICWCRSIQQAVPRTSGRMSEGRTTFPTRVSSAGAVRYGLESPTSRFSRRSAGSEAGCDKGHGLPLVADAFASLCWAFTWEGPVSGRPRVLLAHGPLDPPARPVAAVPDVVADSSAHLQQPRHTWDKSGDGDQEEEEGSERDGPPRAR